jgi:hypothetical protein
MSASTEEPTSFVVVLSGESAARFQEEHEPMVIRDFPTAVGLATLSFRTAFANEGHEANVPRELWIDVRGDASCTLDTAINAYAAAGLSFLPVVALSANASVEDVQPKLAFDNTPAHDPREYFQSFVAQRAGLPPVTRRVDVPATLALITTLAVHPESERLIRAAEQYRLALSHWMRGHESLALMHLFMGMEVLTTCALRRECAAAGLDDEGLACAWGIDVDAAPVKSVWRRELDSEVRRRVLFQGDVTTLTKAKRASDGLEHGFLDFMKARTLADETRDTTAAYLRKAILELAEVDEETKQRLLEAPYDKPLKSWLTKYIRGKFVGDAADLADPTMEYPIFHWQTKIKSVSRTETGGYELTPDEQLTAQFNPDVEFREMSFEVWGPEGAKPTTTPGTAEIKTANGGDLPEDEAS